MTKYDGKPEKSKVLLNTVHERVKRTCKNKPTAADTKEIKKDFKKAILALRENYPSCTGGLRA